ncbi:hypothetical protein [Stenotrophomonas sp. RG-453]|uniref:hypothetical protein n=1 Tax=Stenotrophomonas sp. RG-453 TaxID=2957502 RepID=UPI0029CA90C9|nr:hypothetical protein [Stenotrophomonas sp. RG-453]MDX5515104.1 hypothetical protein [Stenotrophomonas sp. RG-453]
MALPGSGALSFEAIRAEFGGGYPVYAHQYFRGAGLVPDVGANANVPTGGIMYLSWFYNAVKATPFQASITSWLSGQWAQSTQGTVSRSATVSCSGGTGNYSIVSRTVTGGASISHSGLTITVSATGRNQEKSGTYTVVVTDGVTNITVSGSYSYSFGVPL